MSLNLNTKVDIRQLRLQSRVKAIVANVFSEVYGSTLHSLAAIELYTQEDGSGRYLLEIWSNNLICWYIDTNGWHRLWSIK